MVERLSQCHPLCANQAFFFENRSLISVPLLFFFGGVAPATLDKNAFLQSSQRKAEGLFVVFFWVEVCNLTEITSSRKWLYLLACAWNILLVCLVMFCVCLLTSLFVYWWLACNHSWHQTSWCKLNSQYWGFYASFGDVDLCQAC